MSDNFQNQAEPTQDVQAQAAPVEGEAVQGALSDGEIAEASGGHITTDTSIGHDIGTVIGTSARGYYEAGKALYNWITS